MVMGVLRVARSIGWLNLPGVLCSTVLVRFDPSFVLNKTKLATDPVIVAAFLSGSYGEVKSSSRNSPGLSR